MPHVDKEARREYFRQHYLKTREEKLAYAKQYTKENRAKIKESRLRRSDKIREVTREYREKNSAQVKKWRSDFHQRNRAEQIAKNREWKSNNPDRVILQQRRYYAEHADEIRANARASYLKNAEKRREQTRQWQKKHPVEKKRSKYMRRALEKHTGSVTGEQWAALIKSFNYTCLRCRKREPEIKLTMDHIIPLARGGRHLIDNIQPLCAACNTSKGTKAIDYRNQSRSRRTSQGQQNLLLQFSDILGPRDCTTPRHLP